jgi:hypothetical protein
MTLDRDFPDAARHPFPFSQTGQASFYAFQLIAARPERNCLACPAAERAASRWAWAGTASP